MRQSTTGRIQTWACCSPTSSMWWPAHLAKNLMDTDLNWNSYIKSITKSTYYCFKNIAKIKGLVAKKDTEKLNHALIFSSPDYCNVVFTGLTKKINLLSAAYSKCCCWVLTSTRKMDHITPILKSLHWLHVCKMIDFKILLMVYKAFSGLGPKHINDLFESYKASRPLRSSGTGILNIPWTRTKQSEAAFSVFMCLSCWINSPHTCGV